MLLLMLVLSLLLSIFDKNFEYDSNHLKKVVNKNTFAIIFVHLFGIPIDIKKQLKDLQFKNIKIIEDCAESWVQRSKEFIQVIFLIVLPLASFQIKLLRQGREG